MPLAGGEDPGPHDLLSVWQREEESDLLRPTAQPTQQYGTFTAGVSEVPPSRRSMDAKYKAVAQATVEERSSIDSTAEMMGDTDRPDDCESTGSDAERGQGDAEETNPRSRPRLILSLLVLVSITILAVAAGLLYQSQHSEQPSPAVPPARILVVGDSITHGYQADYTWRYRLWEWLHASYPQGANITSVGPYKGTYPPPDASVPPEPQPTTPGLQTRTYGGYALDVDPSFLLDGDGGGRSHFSHWGLAAWQVKDLVGDMVREYQPDYVLMALGFNDLAWVKSVEGTLNSVRVIVEGARDAKPDVSFAIANVPQRTKLDGPQWLPDMTDRYNGLLEKLLGNMTTEESPLWLVRMREAYDCDQTSCPASHDGLHPNARGEFQIAKAFSQVMHERFDLGSGSFTIPAQIPPRPCEPPQNVTASGTMSDVKQQHITVAWDHFYSAFGYFLTARRKGSSWGSELHTEYTKFNLGWPGDGQEWEVRLKSYCGDQQNHSSWSDVVSMRT